MAHILKVNLLILSLFAVIFALVIQAEAKYLLVEVEESEGKKIITLEK